MNLRTRLSLVFFFLRRGGSPFFGEEMFKRKFIIKRTKSSKSSLSQTRLPLFCWLRRYTHRSFEFLFLSRIN